MDTLEELQALVVEFSRRRGWNNTPANLATSVAIEAAEILEIYQWKATTATLSAAERAELALECADVLWYLLRLCKVEGIDLARALREKAEINAGRFPEAAGAR